MYADSLTMDVAHLKAIRRRPAGAAAWREAVRNLIASEKEDLKDMAKLRELLANDVKGLRLLAQMQERKTERITELTQLLEYRDPKPRAVDSGPSDEPLFPVAQD